jgi:hypothetical protein
MASKPLAQVIQGTLAQVSDLVQQTTALIKAQASRDSTKVGVGVAMIVVALVAVAGVPPLLILAFVWGLVAAGLPPWAAYLIAVALALVLTVGCLLVAKANLSKAVKGSKQTTAAIKGSFKALAGHFGDDTATPDPTASPAATPTEPVTPEG